MNLSEIRKQYPDYDNLSDDQLARGFHQKFYTDMPWNDFKKKIEYVPGRVVETKPIEIEKPSFAKDVALQTAKDVVGVIQKVQAGVTEAITFGVVKPEKGTVGIPFTSIQKKVREPISKILKERYGVSPEIAESPYIGIPGQFMGIILPWSITSRLVGYGVNYLRALRIGKNLMKITDTARRTEAAGNIIKKAAARVGQQAITGGIVGGARVREEDESLLRNVLTTAALGAGLQMLGEGVNVIATSTGFSRYGAYRRLKKDFTDLLYKNRKEPLSKAEVEDVADMAINKAAQNAGLEKLTRKDLNSLRKSVKDIRGKVERARAERGEPVAEPRPEEAAAETQTQKQAFLRRIGQDVADPANPITPANVAFMGENPAVQALGITQEELNAVATKAVGDTIVASTTTDVFASGDRAVEQFLEEAKDVEPLEIMEEPKKVVPREPTPLQLVKREAVAEEKVEPKQVHDYSNTQVNIPEKEASEVRSFAKEIPDAEIYEDPKDDSYGRIDDPHVTVRYGMETLDPKEIEPAFKGVGPIKIKMGKVSIFETDKYDVVKIDIESEDLEKANKQVGETVDLPGETHKEYKPHATIAYVKKGEGKKYIGNTFFEGKEITIDEITLISKDGKVYPIKLTGKEEIIEEAKPIATFAHYWEVPGKEPIPFYTVKGGRYNGSTIAAKTLEKEGIAIPETPEKPVKVEKPPTEAIGVPGIEEKAEAKGEVIPKVKDEIDSLIEQYEATGRVAHRYPKKKEISLSGRTMSEKVAITKMKEVIKGEAPKAKELERTMLTEPTLYDISNLKEEVLPNVEQIIRSRFSGGRRDVRKISTETLEKRETPSDILGIPVRGTYGRGRTVFSGSLADVLQDRKNLSEQQATSELADVLELSGLETGRYKNSLDTILQQVSPEDAVQKGKTIQEMERRILELLQKSDANRIWRSVQEQKKSLIQQALSEGKPIPDKVLAGYPQLKKVPKPATIPPVAKEPGKAAEPTAETPKAEGGVEYNKRAIRKYGTTTIPESMGFITREGKAIDSSGIKQGSRSQGRNIDHREIAQEALGDAAKGDGWSANMHQFMEETGDIRVVGARDEFNIDVPIIKGMPSDKQLALLRKTSSGKKIYYDFTGKDGNVVKSGEGLYSDFLRDLKEVVKGEKEISESLAQGKVPKQLKPLEDFIKEHGLTEDEVVDARFNRENPLYDNFRKAMDKTTVGVTKIWSDFGFKNVEDFYNKVIKPSPKPPRPPEVGGAIGEPVTYDVTGKIEQPKTPYKVSEETRLALAVEPAGYKFTKTQQKNAIRTAPLIINWLKRAGADKEVLDRITVELKPFIDLRGKNITKTLRDWSTEGVDMGRILGATTFSKYHALIQLAMNGQNIAGLERSTYHEWYHVAKRWMLPQSDVNALAKHFKTEESEADSFADYMKNSKTIDKEPGFIKRLFLKLKRMINIIRNGLKGKGFKRAEDIFGKIRTRAYRPKARGAETTAIGMKGETRATLREPPESATIPSVPKEKGKAAEPTVETPKAEGVEEKVKLFRKYGATVKGNKVILYRGGDVSKDELRNLRYGDYLSASEKGPDITGNEGADAYGKNVVLLELPLEEVEVTGAGEFQYKGQAESLKSGTKYPEAIYKAFNDYYGSNFTAKEVDKENETEVRNVASMALEGGREEFDELMAKHLPKPPRPPLEGGQPTEETKLSLEKLPSKEEKLANEYVEKALGKVQETKVTELKPEEVSPEAYEKIKAQEAQKPIDKLIEEAKNDERLIYHVRSILKKAMSIGKKEGIAKQKAHYQEVVARAKARKEQIAKIRKMIDELKKVDTEKMSPQEAEPVKDLLEGINLVKPTKRTVARLTKTREYLESDYDAELPGYVMENLKRLDKSNIRDMSVEEIASIHTAVMHYIHLNKLKNTIKVRREARRKAEVLRASVAEMKPPKKVKDEIVSSQKSKVGRTKKTAKLITDTFGIRHDHYDLIIESLAGQNSTMDKVLYQGIKEGIIEQLKYKQDTYKKFLKDLGDDFSEKHGIDDIGKWLNEEVVTGKFRLTRGERMALLRHALNEGNLRHLLAGGFGFRTSDTPNRVYKITAKELNEILQSLTPAEKHFAGDPVNKLFEEQYKRLNDVFYAKNGYPLPKTTDPYYPIEVMPITLGTDLETVEALEQFKGKWTRIGLEKGMLEKRVKSRKPLYLSSIVFDINRSVMKSAAYVGLELPLSNASKLLYDQYFRTELENRYGKQTWREIEKGLRDIAGDYQSYTTVEEMALKLKNNLSVAMLGVNPFVMFKQVLSLPIYLPYVKAEYMIQGMIDFTVHPIEVSERHKMFSPEYLERVEGGYSRDVADVFKGAAMKRLYAGRTTVKEKFMGGIQLFDRTAVSAGMQGAVLQVLDEFAQGKLSKEVRIALDMKDSDIMNLTPAQKMKQAYKFADYTTERTQPMFSPEHRSSLSRGATLEKLATMFGAFTNQALNLMRRTYREVRRTGDKAAYAKCAKALFLILVVNTMGVMAIDEIRNRLYGRKGTSIAGRILNTWTGYMFFVRDLASSVISKIEKGTFLGYDVELPIQRVPELLSNVIANGVKVFTEKSDKKRSKAATRFVDDAFNLILTMQGIPYETPKKLIVSATKQKKEATAAY